MLAFLSFLKRSCVCGESISLGRVARSPGVGSRRPGEESAIVKRRTQLVWSVLVCLALAIGIGGGAGGCGGSTGSQPQAEGEPAPKSAEMLKQSMKERAAALKGRPGKARGAP